MPEARTPAGAGGVEAADPGDAGAVPCGKDAGRFGRHMADASIGPVHGRVRGSSRCGGRLGGAAGTVAVDGAVGVRMHVLRRDLVRGRTFGSLRQHHPQYQIGDGGQAARRERQDDRQDAHHDGVDAEVVGYAGADSARQGVARAEQLPFSVHAFPFCAPPAHRRRSVPAAPPPAICYTDACASSSAAALSPPSASQAQSRSTLMVEMRLRRICSILNEYPPTISSSPGFGT